MAFGRPAQCASGACTTRARGADASCRGRSARGQQLYAVHCATCHGSRGEGDGPGAAGLLPAPSNLAEHDYAPERITVALWNGVAGTAMPAWRDHSLDDLAALVEAVPGTERDRAGAVAARQLDGARSARVPGQLRAVPWRAWRWQRAGGRRAADRASQPDSAAANTRARARDAARRHPRNADGAVDLPADRCRDHRRGPVCPHALCRSPSRSHPVITDVSRSGVGGLRGRVRGGVARLAGPPGVD